MGILFIKPPRSFRVRYRNQFWYGVKNNKCKDDVNRRENKLAEKNKEQLYDAYMVPYI